MNDEIIKSIRLGIKVDEGDLAKVEQTLAKATTEQAKGLPSAVDQLASFKLTNIKNEFRDLNTIINSLSRSLKEVTGELATQSKITQGGGAGVSSAPGQRPSLPGGAPRPAAGWGFAGLAAVGLAGQAVESIGQFQRVSAEQTGKDINARLDSIQQLMAPVKREQDLYASGNLIRLSLERNASEQARNVTRAQMAQERQQLEANVAIATGGFGKRVAQYGGIGATAGGIFGGGLPGAAIVGGIGVAAGATQGVVENIQARRNLSRYQENQEGRYAELYNQNRQRLSQNPDEQQLQAFAGQSVPMERMRQRFGGDSEQLAKGLRPLQGSAYTEEEMRGMMPTYQARAGGIRGGEIVRGANRLTSQGYQGDIGTQANLLTAISKQGVNPNDLEKQFRAGQTAAGGESVYQNNLNQYTASILERSNARLGYGNVAGRAGYIAGTAAPGEDPQQKMQAFNQIMALPDYMKASGTMENQLFRSNIRATISKAGIKGGMAASLENMISGMDMNSLSPGSESWNMLKGFGIDPQEIRHERVKSTQQRLNTMLPKDLAGKLETGHFKNATDRRKSLRSAAMIELGGVGIDGQPLSNAQLDIEGRKLMTELHPGLRAGAQAAPGGPTDAYGLANKGLAESTITSKNAALRQGQGRVGTDQGFTNEVNSAILQPAPPQGGGGFGGEIEDVKMALDAFVAAVNGATSGLGGVPHGQHAAKQGAANSGK